MRLPLRMTAQEAHGRLQLGEKISFVDTRNPTAFAEANEQLPGSIRVPANQVDEHAHILPRERTIVTYCT